MRSPAPQYGLKLQLARDFPAFDVTYWKCPIVSAPVSSKNRSGRRGSRSMTRLVYVVLKHRDLYFKPVVSRHVFKQKHIIGHYSYFLLDFLLC